MNKLQSLYLNFKCWAVRTSSPLWKPLLLCSVSNEARGKGMGMKHGQNSTACMLEATQSEEMRWSSWRSLRARTPAGCNREPQEAQSSPTRAPTPGASQTDHLVNCPANETELTTSSLNVPKSSSGREWRGEYWSGLNERMNNKQVQWPMGVLPHCM